MIDCLLTQWAVAGRSETKLLSVLKSVGVRSGLALDDIPVIIADVQDTASIDAMTQRTKLLMNCTGPYRDYGEPVVRSCVQNCTHYIDITGEPQFMETMQLKYNQEARQNNVYVVSGCGFDSIPCDLGVNFTKDKFNGKLVTVETYLRYSINQLI